MKDAPNPFDAFDNPPDRKNSHCYKWDYNQKKFADANLIPLWIADMDFAIADPIITAIKARTEHPVFGYSMRTKAYVNAIIDWLQHEYQWRLNESDLLFYPPGTVAAINALVNEFSSPNDEIIVQTPAYPPLLKLVTRNGRQLITNPLVYNSGQYHMDLDHLRSIITPQTKILILCSPHNPTGRVWTEAELNQINQICEAHNILVISDEVHADIRPSNVQHFHFSRLAQSNTNSITIISSSKSFNLASLPQSTLICLNPQLRRSIKMLIDKSHLSLDNEFSAVATQAAYSQSRAWLQSLNQYIALNRDRVKLKLEQELPQVKLVEAQGTYLAWVDFSGLNLPHETIRKLLVKKARVGLYDGLLFGEEGRGFFRINLACSKKLLEEALHNIIQAFS
ncbi:MalY/PatB family protein [Aliikangiella sp. IMCC44653]